VPATRQGVVEAFLLASAALAALVQETNLVEALHDTELRVLALVLALVHADSTERLGQVLEAGPVEASLGVVPQRLGEAQQAPLSADSSALPVPWHLVRVADRQPAVDMLRRDMPSQGLQLMPSPSEVQNRSSHAAAFFPAPPDVASALWSCCPGAVSGLGHGPSGSWTALFFLSPWRQAWSSSWIDFDFERQPLVPALALARGQAQRRVQVVPLLQLLPTMQAMQAMKVRRRTPPPTLLQQLAQVVPAAQQV